MLKKTYAVLFLLLLTTPHKSFAKLMEEDRNRNASLTVQPVPLPVGSIPRGAQRVLLLRLLLRASCTSDVRIDSIRVRQTGLGSSSDLQGVYLLQGNRRLNRSVRISSDDEKALLRPGKGLVVPACESIVLDVAADIEPSVEVGSQFAFTVESATDIETDASSLQGIFPLVSAGLRDTVTPRGTGLVTVTFVPLQKTIRTLRNQSIAKFLVKADGSFHQLLHAVTLTNRGSARDDDLRNLYLVQSDNRALTNVMKQLDGERVSLTFLRSYFLRRGTEVLFELRGTAWRSRKTIDFTLEEPSDLSAQPSVQRGR